MAHPLCWTNFLICTFVTTTVESPCARNMEVKRFVLIIANGLSAKCARLKQRRQKNDHMGISPLAWVTAALSDARKVGVADTRKTHHQIDRDTKRQGRRIIELYGRNGNRTQQPSCWNVHLPHLEMFIHSSSHNHFAE